MTISSATEGAAIYYTTDDTEPTTESTRYTGAITVDQNTLIRAIAVKYGMADSEETTAIYTLQETPAPNPATLILPADLAVIEESAFEGATDITVVDASHVASIGRNAFKGCANLTQIRLPADCTIDASAFAGCGTVYVFTSAGGTTQTYCLRNDNPCVFVEEEKTA